MPKEYSVERIVELYTVQHLTYREIGALIGVSHATVYNVIKDRGIQAQAGTQVAVVCAVCNKRFEKHRSRWKASVKHYCSRGCYGVSMHNAGYIDSTRHRRLSRQVVRLYHDLQPWQVVHHHDSNQTNISVSNLAVFDSQADHMSFERGGKGQPIWDGRTVNY
jgi:hypothetical protein